MSESISRRRLLGVMAGGAALGVTGGAAAVALGSDEEAAASSQVQAAIPFEGEHQAGIVTPSQDRLHFVAFDVTTPDRERLRDLLKAWTSASRSLTAGLAVGARGAVDGPPDAPPDDTGEALDLPAAGLTLTLGFGPTLFDERFGLADRRPAALAALPSFAADALEPSLTGGDLCIQACAYDEQVAMHAVRQLARIGAGVVNPRYVQLGHVRTAGVTGEATTPRNLMGFKDGTANLDPRDPDLLRDHVWVPPSDGPGWMIGGSYLVTRRIRMVLETWDRTSLREQEAIIGRFKGDGAPLSGGSETTPIDFSAAGEDGETLVPDVAHVRLAHPSQHGGARLLRRGYNFMDGADRLGRMDAGLFFMAYQRDPRTHFVPVQTALARSDVLNEYIKHVGSGLWAIPPGLQAGGSWADHLFA